MIKLLLSSIFTVIITALCAQDVTGTYTDVTNADKETDSLILYADSTYRYAFYYPKYSVSEYYTGKWRYQNGTVILENAGMKNPAFILAPGSGNGAITQLRITDAKLRRKKKGQVLIKQP